MCFVYIIYICVGDEKIDMRTMTNDIAVTKKKVIDIKGKTFRALSVMSAQSGTNLKNLIEHILNAYNEGELKED